MHLPSPCTPHERRPPCSGYLSWARSGPVTRDGGEPMPLHLAPLLAEMRASLSRWASPGTRGTARPPARAVPALASTGLRRTSGVIPVPSIRLPACCESSTYPVPGTVGHLTSPAFPTSVTADVRPDHVRQGRQALTTGSTERQEHASDTGYEHAHRVRIGTAWGLGSTRAALRVPPGVETDTAAIAKASHGCRSLQPGSRNSGRVGTRKLSSNASRTMRGRTRRKRSLAAMQRTRTCPSGHNKHRQMEIVSAPARWQISTCFRHAAPLRSPIERSWMT